MLRRLIPFAADLWQHRDLIWQFTARNVELRHKGSHLGLVWSILNPLLLLGLYVVVFGYIFGGSFGILPGETKIDYGLGIFFGLSLYHFVAEVFSGAPGLIVNNPNFVKKVVFPIEILPAASVMGAAFHLLVSLVLVLTGVALIGPGLSLSVIWLPVVLLPVLLLGVIRLFSALGVFFRDIGQLMQFLSVALMFASAVFYSAQNIPPELWTYMRFNPVLLAIELARDAALWGRPLNLHHVAYLYTSGALACYLGHAVFRRLRPAFADVL